MPLGLMSGAHGCGDSHKQIYRGVTAHASQRILGFCALWQIRKPDGPPRLPVVSCVSPNTGTPVEALAHTAPRVIYTTHPPTHPS